MVFIDDKPLYEEPACCGQCPFLYDHSTHMFPAKGPFHCAMFDEWHHRMTSPPRRCSKLFRKALEYPDGSRLAITKGYQN